MFRDRFQQAEPLLFELCKNHLERNKEVKKDTTWFVWHMNSMNETAFAVLQILIHHLREVPLSQLNSGFLCKLW